MRLKNTSRYPTDEVRRLVEFGMRGIRTERLEVHVKNSQHAYRGMAYHGVPSMSSAWDHKTVDRLVTIGVGLPTHFPVAHYNPYKRAPHLLFETWQEAIVGVAAHEARHIQQMQRHRPLSEVDCIKHEAKRLTEYRLTPLTRWGG